MPALDANVLLKLQRLESDLKVVFHDLCWSEKLPCTCPDELISRCIAAGLKKEQSLQTVALHMGVPVIFSSDKIDLSSGFFVCGGYYSRSEGRMYLRGRVKEAAANPTQFGLLVEDPKFSFADSTLSPEQVLTIHSMAKLVRDLRPTALADDVVFRAGVALGAYGQRSVPLAPIDTFPLGLSYARVINKSWTGALWLSAIEHVESHIVSRSPGRLVFLCGDYITQEVSSVLSSKITSRTMFTASTSVADCDVTILSMDDLSKKEAQLALETARRRDGYLVMTSSAGNMTQLIERALAFFTVGELSANWGGHYFRRVLPALCKHCRIEDHSLVHIGDETLNITEDMSSHFSRGKGCSHCAEGYHGHAVVAEDMGERPAFIFMLLRVFKDGRQGDEDGEVLLSSEKSLYAFSGAYYRSTKGTGITLLSSLKGLVRTGTVQVADTLGLLV